MFSFSGVKVSMRNCIRRHEDLLSQGGTYHDMWHQQSSKKSQDDYTTEATTNAGSGEKRKKEN